MSTTRRRIAVIGSGPAGLMAATRAMASGAEVHLFEKRKGLGRKLLIAGSSGLNVSHDAPIDEFLEFYRMRDPDSFRRLAPLIRNYPAPAWLEFIRSLGHEVFSGTSRRWFVREMKASGLLSSWTAALEKDGARIHTDRELVDFQVRGRVEVSFRRPSESLKIPEPYAETASPPLTESFDAVVLALGGGSWESSAPRWPELLQGKGIVVRDFRPSNVGYEVNFSEALIKEAEGKPIKNCTLRTRLGEKQGELVITRYGLEGTPVYFVGCTGEAWLDLKPGVSAEALSRQLARPLRENLSPLRRLKKLGGLSDATLALVFHGIPSEKRAEVHGNLQQLVAHLKRFPVRLERPRPLEEAISSSGGVTWDELDDQLMLKKFPGVFLAGEMIDWDAPTGGFLIQASIATGFHAGQASVDGFRSNAP